jgi:diguanylate cyclase (GGDEF)-like protein/putative nucleotidyltransferase with HDIG domain
VAPQQRRLAGLLSGVLYGGGAITLALCTVLPGLSHVHQNDVLIISGVALAWALASIFLVDWQRAPGWLTHVSCTLALPLIALAVASSGGGDSPASVYLFSIAVYAANFYSRPVAYAYLVGCVITAALPLLYDPRATGDEFLAGLVISTPALVFISATIIAAKRRQAVLKRRAERLANEQGALRRVATAVVGGQDSAHIYDLVAREAAGLLHGGAAGILRLEEDSRNESTGAIAIVTGSWADRPSGRYEPGAEVVVRGGSDIAQALTTGRPVRIDNHPRDSQVARLGYSASIVAPIRVAEENWGVVAVTGAERSAFNRGDEQRLMAFGDLLATAIASIEDRAKLAAQATTDPLTGLANHRALQQRLTVEAARAARHDTPLSVAVIDIDHFKQINDSARHETGDDVLVQIAQCLTGLARAEDTLGRVGGDEIAWVLPDTPGEQALLAVERARRQIAETMADPYQITVSAGICDTSVTEDPSQLIDLADGALYWSKAHGRDQCWIYDPTVIDELSAQQRAERLERSRTLVGLRALARAIDAKDPATSRHSERVAELAGRLARAVGWSAERAQLLSEAALVHDVGKIGISENLLRKPAALTDPERKQIEGHAELGARIVEDVLVPEQVEWIRTHHERPDGRGYPRGLRGPDIPEGGALLAVAEAWDAMTASRVYGELKSTGVALAECEQLIGQQFSKTAVTALLKLHAAGQLDVQRPTTHRLTAAGT